MDPAEARSLSSAHGHLRQTSRQAWRGLSDAHPTVPVSHRLSGTPASDRTRVGCSRLVVDWSSDVRMRTVVYDRYGLTNLCHSSVASVRVKHGTDNACAALKPSMALELLHEKDLHFPSSASARGRRWHTRCHRRNCGGGADGIRAQLPPHLRPGRSRLSPAEPLRAGHRAVGG